MKWLSLGAAENWSPGRPGGRRNSRGFWTRKQVLRSRDDDNARQARQLELQHLPAQGRKPIVTSSLVVVGSRHRTSRSPSRTRDLLDQSRCKHPLNRAIERTWSHPDLAVGHRLDFLRDCITVSPRTLIGLARPSTIGEREQDVQNDWCQRQQILWIGRSPHRRHLMMNSSSRRQSARSATIGSTRLARRAGR